MPGRTDRGRPEAIIGKPAVLNGVREDFSTGNIVNASMHVKAYNNQQSFSLDGKRYQVVSAEKSPWNQPDTPPLWTMFIIEEQ